MKPSSNLVKLDPKVRLISETGLSQREWEWFSDQRQNVRFIVHFRFSCKNRTSIYDLIHLLIRASFLECFCVSRQNTKKIKTYYREKDFIWATLAHCPILLDCGTTIRLIDDKTKVIEICHRNLLCIHVFSLLTKKIFQNQTCLHVLALSSPCHVFAYAYRNTRTMNVFKALGFYFFRICTTHFSRI